MNEATSTLPPARSMSTTPPANSSTPSRSPSVRCNWFSAEGMGRPCSFPRAPRSTPSARASAACEAFRMMLTRTLTIFLLFLPLGGAQTAGSTVVGIRGSQFTINGQLSYTPPSGFPSANTNLAGTLLNVRAVQAIFDDANYPNQGSRLHPYQSNTLGPIFWDYPDGPWDPERNVREFLAALPDWRRCGLLAFTVNLQGGGPPDGNYGESITDRKSTRLNSSHLVISYAVFCLKKK